MDRHDRPALQAAGRQNHLAFGGFGESRLGQPVIELVADDLPCPWCGEATHESDRACRGCGRRFG